MAAVTTAVVGVAASAYSASRNRSAARDAARQQQDAIDQQVALGREQLAEGQRRYDEWRDMFMPGFEALRDMAFERQGPDYDSVTADVNSAFGASADMQRRQQQRFGIKPGDGAWEANERSYGLGRALAMVQGRNSARRQSEQDNWNRLAGFAGAGNSLRAGADSMTQAAYNGIFSAFGNQAGAAGQRWGFHTGQANQNMQDAMGFFGYGMGQFGGGGGG